MTVELSITGAQTLRKYDENGASFPLIWKRSA